MIHVYALAYKSDWLQGSHFDYLKCLASIRNTDAHGQTQAERTTVQPQSNTPKGHGESTPMQRGDRGSWETRSATSHMVAAKEYNKDPTAYPLRTPRTRLRTKNEPRMIRLTKYTHGHSHPIASFTCKM